MDGGIQHVKRHDVGDSKNHKGDIYNGLVGSAYPITAGNYVIELQKMTESIAAALRGLDWQESVLDRYDPTGGLPAATLGHRYISTATANGWTVDYIYEGDGAAFTETIPNEGFCATVEDENTAYYYGSVWVKFGTIIDHANLLNVTEDQHHNKQHAINSATEHTSTINEDSIISADSNGLPKDTDVKIHNLTRETPLAGLDYVEIGNFTGVSHSLIISVGSDETGLEEATMYHVVIGKNGTGGVWWLARPLNTDAPSYELLVMVDNTHLYLRVARNVSTPSTQTIDVQIIDFLGRTFTAATGTGTQTPWPTIYLPSPAGSFVDQAPLYIVSELRGVDDYTRDGSWFKPFKTVNFAIAAGVAASIDPIKILIIDGDHPGIVIPGTVSDVAISGVEPLTSQANAINIELDDGASVQVDNLYVEFIKEGAACLGAGAFVEECIVERFLDNAETGSATVIDIVSSNMGIETATLADLAAASGWLGSVYDVNLGVFYFSHGTDMNSKKITNVLDPTANQDAATKKYVDDNTGAGSDTTAIHDNVADEIHQIGGKSTPVDADAFIIEDSADGTPFAKKELTWSNIKATMKAYMDTLYAALIHKTRHQNGGADEISLAGLSGEPVDTVNKSLFDAQTILAATIDDTPAALPVPVQTLVGRITAGNIDALTVTEVWTLLGGKPTFVSQFSVGDSLAGNQTAYLNNFIFSDIQSEAQSSFGKCRIVKLIINIPSSTLNSSSTFQIEINGTPVGTVITYAATESGRKSQVESIAVAADDLIDIKAILGGLPGNFIDIAEVTVVFEGVQ